MLIAQTLPLPNCLNSCPISATASMISSDAAAAQSVHQPLEAPRLGTMLLCSKRRASRLPRRSGQCAGLARRGAW
uniref:Uncharacterized protein n=1 Tax=Arundo donax TaxID=35708 RepID=A0A0A9DIU7_ARUDO